MPNSSSKKSGLLRGVSFKKSQVVLGVSCLFLIAAMIYVWTGVKLVRLSYDYQELRTEHSRLYRENRLVRLERESLRSLPRVEAIARNDLGMKNARPQQTVAVFIK
jgi:cell division protein FtsL